MRITVAVIFFLLSQEAITTVKVEGEIARSLYGIIPGEGVLIRRPKTAWVKTLGDSIECMKSPFLSVGFDLSFSYSCRLPSPNNNDIIWLDHETSEVFFLAMRGRPSVVKKGSIMIYIKRHDYIECSKLEGPNNESFICSIFL